ncbi:DMT family transporter [Ancylobacter lacus]|uniref:DMT family transporter n=1 Tax=Ancylobacter lacus TaxID=2579970 RepID=UPI001BD08107|nr:DMT family transporter [Ancylobacter lacus]MBS7540629.1 DMT family transporter [Ancylobacter lacus]
MTTTTDERPAAARRPLAGYALGAAGAILFAAKGVIIKIAYGWGIDAETLLALRMGLSLPFYLVIGAMAVAGARTRGVALPSPGLVAKALGVGVLGYWFSSYVDFLGLRDISASFERLILFTYPMFVALFGALLFRQPIRPRALVAFAASYAGLAVIFLQNLTMSGPDTARGAGFVFLAAISFALYQLCARDIIARMGSGLFTCIAMTGAAAVALAQFVVLRPVASLLVEPKVFLIGVMLAIGATVLPSFLMNAALQRISAQANATIGTISPVATMALAMLVLGETVTPAELAGAVLVIGSIGWFTLADRRR